jgi:cation:H+ antiporter
MFLTYLLFALGFVLLVKGADWLIEGSVAIARKFKISEIAIGLTIVAFGTSAPELVVNVVSSLRASGELVVGNIIGSNIANLALVLGTAGILAPLAIKKSLAKKEIPFGILGAILIYLLAMRGDGMLTLERWSGGVLLALFVIFLWLVWRSKEIDEKLPPQPKLDSSFAGICIGGGLLALGVGGELVVDSAVRIAESFGVSEKLIGLTLVAIGTSLPELVTSAVAVKKGKIDIAIGNVVGSNVFNIFWVLGVSALINPISFAANVITDLGVLVGITLLLLLATFTGEKHKLDKWEATLMLSAYVGYLGFVVWRG